MLLPGFTEATQQKLTDAKVLLVGVGGLGCPAAQYLTAAGVGTIGIADFDVVSISNLHRQILYTAEETGKLKVEIACKKLSMQNPAINIVPHPFKITSHNVMELLEQYDMVVDGTDNFETRYLLNDACVLSGKPLVYGGIYQYEGQVAVWNVKNDDGSRTPNYRDLFPSVDASAVPNCAEGGVIPTIAGLIGCMQANEVLKLITGTGENLAGKILIINALTLESRIIKTGRKSRVTINALAPSAEIPVVQAGELAKYVHEDSCLLIDVRNDEERATFHIGGQHIPLALLKETFPPVSIDKPVIFYCASGKRSEEAVKLALQKYPGIKAYSLKGGVKAWREHAAGGIVDG